MTNPTAFPIVFPCKYLRSKEMFYQTDDENLDEYSGGHFWCARTQDAIGPDGKAVAKTECSPPRSCYQE